MPTEAQNVSQSLTHQWLKSSGLKGETEGFIIAAQDQSLPTKNYQTNISKVTKDDKCRLCKNNKETIDHLVSGCSAIAATQYTERHDKVGRYLHWKICKESNISVNDKWYTHTPQGVTENSDVCILWDFSIHTDRTVSANRPDIIIKDKKQNNCLLIDMSVPSDRNISSKEFEKKYKYKDLEIEIQRMWKMKTKVIPVVVGALGAISKDFKSYIENIPGKINSSEVQKSTLLGTAHILRKKLSME